MEIQLFTVVCYLIRKYQCHLKNLVSLKQSVAQANATTQSFRQKSGNTTISYANMVKLCDAHVTTASVLISEIESLMAANEKLTRISRFNAIL